MSALASLLQKKTATKTVIKSGNSALAKLSQPSTPKTQSSKTPAKTAQINTPFGFGGVYNLGANPLDLIKTGHTNFGGLPTKPGFQRNDVMPQGLGGVNQNPKNIQYQPAKQATQSDKLEKDIIARYNAGKITLGQARNEIAVARQQEQKPLPTQSLFKNFISSIPSALKTVGKTALELPKGLVQPYTNPSPAERQIEANMPKKGIGKIASALVKPITRTFEPIVEPLGKQIGTAIGSKGKVLPSANDAFLAGGAFGLGTAGSFVGGEKASNLSKLEHSSKLEPTTFPESSTKSITLNAGVNPGVDKLIQSDIKPALKGTLDIAKEIKNTLSPQFASKEATATADMVRKAKATVANAATLEEAKFKPVTKHFDKFSEEQNIQNISQYERTGKFTNEPTPGYSKLYKQSTDAAHQVLRTVYKDPVGYVDNYIKRQFKFGSAADEKAALNYFQEKYSKFATDKSPTKERVLDVPLDQALSEMKQAGINVKPVTTNPETLRQWTVANARHAQVFEDLRKLALETKDPNVARILNNATSKGLENSPTFKGIRALNNTINQVQLGLSAFHGTGTAINAGISDMALGLRQLGTGDIVSGSKSLGKSLVPGMSFVRDIIKGDQFLKALKQDNPLAINTLDKINAGGGRIATETEYTNKSLENMTTAFKEGNLIGGVARIPSAVIEQVAKPLMSKAIPRVKIAAYLDLVADIDKRMPNATDAVKTRQYANAWDSIDNRFGQLVYDNLFWNRTAQQLAQVSTRSVGWNLGTIREVGGGLTDLTKTLTGKGVSDRTLYAAALPIYAGMIGAVYQYLHTGEKPKQLIDYFYPKNGLTTKTGQEDRVSLPTYMKDIFAYSKDPLGTLGHKASPLLSIAVDLASNRDYFGDMVRNPNDPAAKQLQQVGQYALTQLKPFTVTNLNKANQEKAKTSQKVEAFFGFNKAPGSVINPNQVIVPHAPRTPEQKAKVKTPKTPKPKKAKTFHF